MALLSLECCQNQRKPKPASSLDKKPENIQAFLKSWDENRKTGRVGFNCASEGSMSTTELMLRGYRLTTAEILYHLPDHPKLLQSFIWQEFDMAPKFPALNKFLHFWETQIDGKLHSVRVASRGLISPAELKLVSKELTLH
jgi:uncharacterized protein Usg